MDRLTSRVENETDEQYFARVRAIRNYRKAVRRDFFRRKAILKKFDQLSPRPGVFTGAALAGSFGERSVAGSGQCHDGDKAFPPITGADETNLCHKTMPLRDDENMGRNDTPPSSSGTDTLSDSGISTAKDQALPGQEQKPAITEEEKQPRFSGARVDK